MQLSIRLHPTLISTKHPLYGINGAVNAISIHGKYSGIQVLRGPGAGSWPTAFAVMNDVFEIINHLELKTFENFSKFDTHYKIEHNSKTSGYFRSISPEYENGVFESKCGILKKHRINICDIRNFPKTMAEGDEALIPDILCIDPAEEKSIQRAKKDLKNSPFVRGEVVYIREDLNGQ